MNKTKAKSQQVNAAGIKNPRNNPFFNITYFMYNDSFAKLKCNFQDLRSEVEVKFALSQCYNQLKQTREAIAIVSTLPSRAIRCVDGKTCISSFNLYVLYFSWKGLAVNYAPPVSTWHWHDYTEEQAWTDLLYPATKKY